MPDRPIAVPQDAAAALRHRLEVTTGARIGLESG